jgi:hypothetical protein
VRAEDRKKQLTPDAAPIIQDRGLGCYLWLAGLLLASLTGVVFTDSKIVAGLAMVFSAVAILTAYSGIQNELDLKRFRNWAEKNRCFAVVLTSDSPKWAGHINDHWLARFGGHVSVLNNSRKKEWRQSIESKSVRRFRRFRDDHPFVIVPRKTGEPAVYRFRAAFIAAFHGDDASLCIMEERMFKEFSEWQQRDSGNRS